MKGVIRKRVKVISREWVFLMRNMITLITMAWVWAWAMGMMTMMRMKMKKVNVIIREWVFLTMRGWRRRPTWPRLAMQETSSSKGR